MISSAPIISPRILSFTPSEEQQLVFDFTALLADAEVLTGTPIVTVSPTGPTIGAPVVNVAAIEDKAGNRTIDVGKAVTAGVTTLTEGEYLLKCVSDTDLGNIRDLRGRMEVKDPT